MNLSFSNSISFGGYFVAALSVLFLCIGITLLGFVFAFTGMLLGLIALRVAIDDRKLVQASTVDPSANRTTEVHAIKLK